jgi:hypothetical protein
MSTFVFALSTWIVANALVALLFALAAHRRDATREHSRRR